MKKINNKGFTLIELLVVLVILTLILSIALPSITATLERSKDKERNSKIKLIESAAELYIDKNKNSLTGVTKITIQQLIDSNFLSTEEAKDPNTNNTIRGCVSLQDIKFYDANKPQCN